MLDLIMPVMSGFEVLEVMKDDEELMEYLDNSIE